MLWGIAIVGLAITVILLCNAESDIRLEYERHADRITYKVGKISRNDSDNISPTNISDVLLNEVGSNDSQIFNRIELVGDSASIELGEVIAGDEHITRHLEIYAKSISDYEQFTINSITPIWRACCVPSRNVFY